jgi:hypothetical protein
MTRTLVDPNLRSLQRIEGNIVSLKRRMRDAPEHERAPLKAELKKVRDAAAKLREQTGVVGQVHKSGRS